GPRLPGRPRRRRGRLAPVRAPPRSPGPAAHRCAPRSRGERRRARRRRRGRGMSGRATSRRRLRARLGRTRRALLERVAEADNVTSRATLYVLRLGAQVIRQWVRDRCPQQAASLAFQAVLSLVPVLAVALAALRATGAMHAESTFVEFLSAKLIPVSRY